MPIPTEKELNELTKIAEERIKQLKVIFSKDTKISPAAIEKAAERALRIWKEACKGNINSGELQLGVSKCQDGQYSYDKVTSTSICRYFQQGLPQKR
jgi:hypothetical protein